LIAALICSGSSDQIATISAKSEDRFWVSILPCFWDLGVNWGINCVFEVSQVFVSSELEFSEHRFPNRRSQVRILPGAFTSPRVKFPQAQVLGLNLGLFGFVFANLQNCRFSLLTCHKRAYVIFCLT
jgi:hypothetical protein